MKCSVFGLSGMELIFFRAVHVLLQFGFVAESVEIAFMAVLEHCLQSQGFLFPALSCSLILPASKLSVGRGLGGEINLEQLTHTDKGMVFHAVGHRAQQ